MGCGASKGLLAPEQATPLRGSQPTSSAPTPPAPGPDEACTANASQIVDATDATGAVAVPADMALKPETTQQPANTQSPIELPASSSYVPDVGTAGRASTAEGENVTDGEAITKEAKAEDEITDPKPEDEERLYDHLLPYLSDGRLGDVRYRQARVKARNAEPCPAPTSLPAAEVEALRQVWQDEWYGFPVWDLVLLTRAAVGRRLWTEMGNDRRRAACERFLLCGPWAASQEPDPVSLARMRGTSSSSAFVYLDPPARRETFLGAFAAGHGLAAVSMLSSDRPNNPSYWDQHTETERGKTMTTAEVCHRIVVPATRAFGAAYVDLFLGPELWGNGKDNVPGLVGAPRRRFLSHAWGMPFMEMATVSVVEGSPPRHNNGPYWIDIFCKNQHVPIKESDLTNNIEGSEGVVLAVYPWPAPLLTTRVWCLFEVVTAKKMGVKMDLKFCPGASTSLYSVMRGRYNAFNYGRVRSDAKKNGLSSVLPGAGELVQAIDVREAQATVASDKVMILSMIEGGEGGFEAMNVLVRQMLEEGLADSAATVVDAIVGEDRLQYMSYERGWD